MMIIHRTDGRAAGRRRRSPAPPRRRRHRSGRLHLFHPTARQPDRRAASPPARAARSSASARASPPTPRPSSWPRNRASCVWSRWASTRSATAPTTPPPTCSTSPTTPTTATSGSPPRSPATPARRPAIRCSPCPTPRRAAGLERQGPRGAARQLRSSSPPASPSTPRATSSSPIRSAAPAAPSSRSPPARRRARWSPASLSPAASPLAPATGNLFVAENLGLPNFDNDIRQFTPAGAPVPPVPFAGPSFTFGSIDLALQQRRAACSPRATSAPTSCRSTPATAARRRSPAA